MRQTLSVVFVFVIVILVFSLLIFRREGHLQDCFHLKMSNCARNVRNKFCFRYCFSLLLIYTLIKSIFVFLVAIARLLITNFIGRALKYFLLFFFADCNVNFCFVKSHQVCYFCDALFCCLYVAMVSFSRLFFFSFANSKLTIQASLKRSLTRTNSETHSRNEYSEFLQYFPIDLSQLHFAYVVRKSKQFRFNKHFT